MLRRNPEKQVLFEFDEQGADEVSEQIMDSYNSGFIDENDRATADNDQTK